MPRIKIAGAEKLNNDILESMEVNEDLIIKLDVLEAFCNNRGLKLTDLNTDVLESFNIDMSQVNTMATILENANPVTDELSKMRALNSTNPIMVLNSLHRAGRHKEAASIQRHYLDFMEAINDVVENDVTIMEDAMTFIDGMYEVFKQALPTE